MLPQTSSSQQQPNKRPPPPLSLFLDSKKGPHRNNETSNPFLFVCFVGKRAKERHTHTHNAKKNVRSFSQIERIFFARVASKTHFCPHKKKAEKEIFREEEHDNNNNDNNNNNNTGCTVVSSKKKTNSGRGRGSDDRGSFSTRHRTP